MKNKEYFVYDEDGDLIEIMTFRTAIEVKKYKKSHPKYKVDPVDLVDYSIIDDD